VVRWLAALKDSGGAMGYQFMWVGIVAGEWVACELGFEWWWWWWWCVWGLISFFLLRFFGVSWANETSDLW